VITRGATISGRIPHDPTNPGGVSPEKLAAYRNTDYQFSFKGADVTLRIDQHSPALEQLFAKLGQSCGTFTRRGHLLQPTVARSEFWCHIRPVVHRRQEVAGSQQLTDVRK
jgi:hypothetical protein